MNRDNDQQITQQWKLSSGAALFTLKWESSHDRLITMLMESQVTKHFWSFTVNKRCSILLNNRGRRGLVLKCIKLLRRHPSLLKPGDPKLIWKDVINTFFLSVIFTVVTKLKELACTMPDGDTGARPWVEAVNKVFSNLLGIAELLGDLDYVRRAVRAHARNVSSDF